MRKKACIFKKKAQIEILLFDKAFTKILSKYFNYSNIFLRKNVAKFSKYTRINNYIIKLEKDKQLLFGLIYNLKLIEFKILKIYIKTNLANNFIKPFKSLIEIFILFD